MKKTVIISIVTSLLVGTVAGTLAGAYGKDAIIPWVRREVLGSRAGSSSAPGPTLSVPAPAAGDAEDAAVAAVARVAPAVVSVVLSKEITFNTTGPIIPFDLFPEFGFPAPGTERREKREIGGGTGFIISPDGLIVTNRHVVADEGAEVLVVLADRRRLPAKVIARDQFIDLAVLKIEAQNLPVASLGDSSVLRIGETVIAIGNTLSQFPNTVTKGIVSGLARRVVAGDGRGASEVIEEAIQTDAAINPGNSGGPLINLRGEVIGVNVATSRAAEGVGFAIPVNTAKQIIESVKTTGRIVRPWLGVRYVPINEAIAERNNLPITYGALVVRGDDRTALAIIPGSPAEKAGIKENDIILELDGVRIDEEHSLAREIAKHKPGDRVSVKILRAGKEQNFTATLEELKNGVQ